MTVSRVKFSTGMFLIRCRLFFYSWNLGTQPVARLVNLFEGLQAELILLQPMESGAQA